MSVRELERELARSKDPSLPPTGAPHLSKEEALALRSRGNVPDEDGRSLRIVLHVRSLEDVKGLSRRRLAFEPDFHEEPTWRREGSVPINVVPLRMGPIEAAPQESWQDEPEVAALEGEWQTSGTIAGIKVPEAYRSFVYKTVLSLQGANLEVTVPAIVASVARWLPPDDVRNLRAALETANA